MKTQRRHDLQHNSLLDNLGETVEYVKARSQIIIISAVTLLVVVGVIWYWQHNAAARRAQGWQEMLTLVGTTAEQDPQYIDKLANVAASYRDPGLRAMAYDQLGNELLSQATFMNLPPQQAVEFRSRAQDAFRMALNEAAKYPEAGAIARMGLATIAANEGDLAMARQHYEAVQNDPSLKGTPYPDQATVQMAALTAAAKLPALAVSSQPATAMVVPSTQPGAQ